MASVWPLVTITDQDNVTRSAIAPGIISASRATDIPAFFGTWFMAQLDRGYTEWTNPWNRRISYVSFVNTRLFVFWSKNPAAFFQHLAELDRRGLDYQFQFTLNDYEQEKLEPGLPPLDERLETFGRLSRMIGRKRAGWRFDPLLLTGSLELEQLASRIERIGDAIAGWSSRLTISFLTPYAKIRKRLKNAGIRELDKNERVRIARMISAFCASWQLPVFTCAVEDTDGLGIQNGSCIDGAGIPESTCKDPGQRRLCGCVASKDIGRYDTCGHGCVYCYANR
ncbi:MAG: DUF1848 domain-containing protein [Chitinispirillaceae bacterium]|jgi:hypothetical protein|nr:DUF1848 domain-containing protein [Chitinispirillaceae bacterium]